MAADAAEILAEISIRPVKRILDVVR